MMKRFIKSVVFLSILAIILINVFKVLWLPKNSLQTFYEQPQNTIDVAYLGASTVYNEFNADLAYEKYGFTTGIVASAAQPLIAAKYLIKDVQKTQNPKLYIIDLSRVADDDIHTETDENLRQTLDTMKYNKNRVELTNKILEYRQVPKKDYINFYLSFLVYHNSWQKIDNYNFNMKDYIFNGYMFTEYKITSTPQDEFHWQEDREELSETDHEVLLDLIDFIKEEDLNVLFIVPARTYSQTEENNQNARINTAIDIIEENDFKVINYNKLDDYVADQEKDFYDDKHLNVYGATKFTLHFAKYIKENYDLPNHQDEDQYSSWDEDYLRFKRMFNEITKEKFEDVVEDSEKTLKELSEIKNKDDKVSSKKK